MFFTPKRNLIKCMYEIPWQVCIWAMVFTWPFKPFSLLVFFFSKRKRNIQKRCSKIIYNNIIFMKQNSNLWELISLLTPVYLIWFFFGISNPLMMQSTQNWNFPDIFVTLNIIWDEIFLIHVVLMITELICFPCLVVTRPTCQTCPNPWPRLLVSLFMYHILSKYILLLLYTHYLCVWRHIK